MTTKKNTGRTKPAVVAAKEKATVTAKVVEAKVAAKVEDGKVEGIEGTAETNVNVANKNEGNAEGDAVAKEQPAREGETSKEGDVGTTEDDGVEEMPEVEEGSLFAIDGLSLPAKLCIQTLEEYVAKMGKGVAVNPSAGLNHQMGLYRAVTNLLSLEGEEFVEVMNRTLDIIHAHRDGAFNDKRLFRFFNNLKLAKDRSKSFERLLSLFTTVCDSSSRSLTLQQVNVEEAVSGVKDGKVQQQLLAYFSK